MTEQQKYPITASPDGHLNAYYLDDCKLVGHRPPYASCLFKIGEWAAGRLGQAVAQCGAAMDRGDCRAQLMREEELSAGHSIFFLDRKKLQAQTVRGENLISVSVKPPPAAKPTPVAPAPSSFGDASYSDAINRAMRESPVIAPTQPAVHAPSVAKAGMSMVEIARAALARAAS